MSKSMKKSYGLSAEEVAELKTRFAESKRLPNTSSRRRIKNYESHELLPMSTAK